MCKIFIQDNSIYFSRSASADLSTMRLIGYSPLNATEDETFETNNSDCEEISESIMKWFIDQGIKPAELDVI